MYFLWPDFPINVEVIVENNSTYMLYLNFLLHTYKQLIHIGTLANRNNAFIHKYKI